MKPKPNLVTAPTHKRFPVCYWSPRIPSRGHCHLYPFSLFTQSFKGTFPLQSFSLLFTFPLQCPQLTSLGPDYPTLPISHSFLLSTHFCESPKASFFTPTLVHSLAYYLEFWFSSEPLYESPAVLFSSSCFSYVFYCAISTTNSYTHKDTSHDDTSLNGPLWPTTLLFYIVKIKQMLIYFIYYIGQFVLIILLITIIKINQLLWINKLYFNCNEAACVCHCF